MNTNLCSKSINKVKSIVANFIRKLLDVSFAIPVTFTDMTKPTRGDIIQLRALRKQTFITRCSKQALAAKSLLIVDSKGHNGKSMSEQLLERHFSVR